MMKPRRCKHISFEFNREAIMRAGDKGMIDQAVFPRICLGTGYIGMARGGQLACKAAAR